MAEKTAPAASSDATTPGEEFLGIPAACDDPMSAAPLLDALRWRMACKRYDPTRQVSDEDFRAILEAGRLSPSSFGLEPWHVLVVEDTELRGELEDTCWGMKKNASRTVVILARKKVGAFSLHAGHMIAIVQGLRDEAKGDRRLMLAQFQSRDFDLTTPEALFSWSCRQCYLMLANMLSAAAELHVDATPVEGFPVERVNELLAQRGLMDPEEYGVAVMAQFGYRDPSHREVIKTRQPFEDVFQTC